MDSPSALQRPFNTQEEAPRTLQNEYNFGHPHLFHGSATKLKISTI